MSAGHDETEARVFSSLESSGHLGLDRSLPTGVPPWRPWLRRVPWFPAAPSAAWEDVYRTWFGEADRPVVNYHLMGGAPPAWDAEIRRSYEGAWREAAAGGLEGWEATPKGRVAKMILCDQLPRHMFRGKAEAFSTDALGLRLADALAADIAAGAPLHVEDAFMVAWPWVHCEDLDRTYRAVWWHASLAAAARGTPFEYRALLNKYGAERHVRLVQRFGRYPSRNRALGREPTTHEVEHLARDADAWERQQTPEMGTLLHHIRAAGFFVRTAVWLVGCRELSVLGGFLGPCVRALVRLG